jgi:tRNA(Arg) A34 adenosine deaminase TadA
MDRSPGAVPTAADLDRLTGGDTVAFVDRLLDVVEQEIVPRTRRGVAAGNKLFGAAVLRKADLSTVIATTNRETGNPLNHGEIQCLYEFYALPRDERPAPADAVFLATHEPCSLCLSGITWAGFDNFFYLFSYEDTKDAFAIPHDLKILDEVFGCPDGGYAAKNHYWSSWGLKDLVEGVEGPDRDRLRARIAALHGIYDELSAVYQASKDGDADIPLK